MYVIAHVLVDDCRAAGEVLPDDSGSADSAVMPVTLMHPRDLLCHCHSEGIPGSGLQGRLVYCFFLLSNKDCVESGCV